MEEQKDYIAESKRIAEEIKATEEHILELDREEKFQKKHVEDLKVQYKEVFIKANIDRLTAFKEECKKRGDKASEQVQLLQNEKHVLRLQLKNEIDGRTFNDKVQEISKKCKKIRELYDTYYNNSIADMVGITSYDSNIIREFIFGSWQDNAESKKEMTIENVFNHRLEILANPTEFAQKITHFSAGGLGACVYNKDVTVAELVRCWEFDEFKFVCPESGETAFIYQFAGHVSAGGYWELTAYCPASGKHQHYGSRDANPVHVHWSTLKSIADPVSRQIKNIKTTIESGK